MNKRVRLGEGPLLWPWLVFAVLAIIVMVVLYGATPVEASPPVVVGVPARRPKAQPAVFADGDVDYDGIGMLSFLGKVENTTAITQTVSITVRATSPRTTYQYTWWDVGLASGEIKELWGEIVVEAAAWDMVEWIVEPVDKWMYR